MPPKIDSLDQPVHGAEAIAEVLNLRDQKRQTQRAQSVLRVSKVDSSMQTNSA